MTNLKATYIGDNPKLKKGKEYEIVPLQDEIAMVFDEEELVTVIKMTKKEFYRNWEIE